MADLPCDADGMCMVCKKVPLDEHVLLCNSCTSPWHMQCLNPPMSCVPLGDWDCPDCKMPPAPPPSSLPTAATVTPNTGSENDMLDKIRSIQADLSLTEDEKARKRQELMAHQASPSPAGGNVQEAKPVAGKQGKVRRNETLEMLDQNLNCIFCMQLAERPVTTPCGHNFCLKCFQRWIGQGKRSCGKCRAPIPSQMASQPRINSALVMAIRLAKAATTSGGGSQGPPKAYHHIENEKRPDKCFTSERAVKTGKANACSGRIFVTIPPDHFGPILAANDPLRNQGVLVGESWEDRMECRQWGAHFPHVAGIAGQSDFGAQSVALSGGYEDDEDHGEWFLYTGSGGRDLSGNKRTNKEQSFDQKFDKSNEALRVSCKRGYPVRVVRSHKEKRSSYAPEKGVRYDGVYRIEKCWRKKGIQGHKVCRYLFVRCDNEPAPWTSDEHGDRPRPLPSIGELKEATDVFERKSSPCWNWMEETGVWGWTTDPPESRKTGGGGGNSEKSSKRKHLSIQQKLLKEFGCFLCRKVMELPLSTPCGHNFCKSCLVGVFAGQQDMRERTGVGGRSLRVQKVMKRCPTCNGDITDFVTCPQVNRQMEDLIQSLKSSVAEDDYEQEPSPREERASSVDNAKEIPLETIKERENELECDPPAVKKKCTERESDSHVPVVVANGHHKAASQVEDSKPLAPNGQHCNEVVSKSPVKPASGGHLRNPVARIVTDTDDAFSGDDGSTDESPAKPRHKGSKKAKRRKVVNKESDADDSDDSFKVEDTPERKGRPRNSISSRLGNRRQNAPAREEVAPDSSEESGEKPNRSGRRKLSGHDGPIVLDSEDEARNVTIAIPRRYTRGQHTAALAASKARKSSGVNPQEIILL